MIRDGGGALWGGAPSPTPSLPQQDDFEKLREIRKRKMIKAQQERQKNILNGHQR